MKYEDYIQSDEWHAQREKVIERFSGKCALCGKKFIKNMHVHHRTYLNKFGSEKELEDLTLLCKVCHRIFHDNFIYNSKTHNFIVGKKKKSIPRKRKISKKSIKNIKLLSNKEIKEFIDNNSSVKKCSLKFRYEKDFISKYREYQFFCKHGKRRPKRKDGIFENHHLGPLSRAFTYIN